MIRYNGQSYPDMGSSPLGNQNFSAFSSQFSIPIYWHREPLFWEATYFYLMSCLRRWRLMIPMSLTPDYLEAEVRALAEDTAANQMFRFTAFRETPITADQPLSSLGWVLQRVTDFQPIQPTDSFVIELYKENNISADDLSTLPITHQFLKELSLIYAFENGYSDCLLLNQEKQLAMSGRGSIWLWSEGTLQTPDLGSGISNDVLRNAFLDWTQNEAKIDVIQQSIAPFALQNADALAILDPYSGMYSVTKYRKKEYQHSGICDLFAAFWEAQTQL